MKFHAAVKKNETIKFAGKRVDLEMIILSEVTQSQKDNAYYLSYVDHSF